MATKFSDFTAQAATGTTFVVGYDGTTNTQYTLAQLATGLSSLIPTIYSADGTVSGNRVVTISSSNKLDFYAGGSQLLQLWGSSSGQFTLGRGASISVGGAWCIGNSAVGAGSGAWCIGNSSVSRSQYNTVVGNNATDTAATNTYNTIIGSSASVTGASNAANVVIGDSALATTSGGIAIGSEARANGSKSISLGQRAQGTGNNSIMLNATGSVAAPSQNSAFNVYMSSNTTPDFRVIGNEGMIPPSITTTVRNAISSPVTGSTIYNTTDNKLQFYNGSAWTDAAGGADTNIYTADGLLQSFRTIDHNGYNLKWDLGTNSHFYETSSGSGAYINFRQGGAQRGAILNVSSGGAMYFRDSGGVDYYSVNQNGFYLNRNAGFGITAQANQRVTIKGSGATSATTSLLVEDSAGADMFSIRDDGAFALGKGASTILATQVAVGRNAAAGAANAVAIGNNATANNSNSVAIGNSAGATYDSISIGSGASSGSNGIAMGQSSAAVGNGVAIGYDTDAPSSSIGLGANAKGTGANSVTLNANGSAVTPSTANEFGVYMTSSTTPDFRVIGAKGMIPPSITTTVRDAISSPISGSTIYNTTDNKLQFYNGTAWTDAGGGGGDNIYTADGTLSGNRTVTMGTNTLSFSSSSAPSVNTVFTFNGTYTSTAGGTGTGGGGFEIAAGYGTRLKPTYLQIYSGATIQGTSSGNLTIHSTVSSNAGYSINARLGVIGKSATSTTDYAFRVQDSAVADMLTVRDDGAFSLGKSASPQGATAITIGQLAETTVSNSIAIGYNAEAAGGIAIGLNADNNQSYSQCIGGNTSNAAQYQTVIGYDADGLSGADRSIAIGASAKAAAQGGIAIGVGANAQNHCIILGRNVGVSGTPDNSVVFSTRGGNNITYSEADSFTWYNTSDTVPDLKFKPGSNSYWNSSSNFGFGNGNTSPTATVDIDGTFRLRSASNVNGKVLTADANGNGTWQDAGGSSLWVEDANNPGNISPANGNDVDVAIGTTPVNAVRFIVRGSGTTTTSAFRIEDNNGAQKLLVTDNGVVQFNGPTGFGNTTIKTYGNSGVGGTTFGNSSGNSFVVGLYGLGTTGSRFTIGAVPANATAQFNLFTTSNGTNDAVQWKNSSSELLLDMKENGRTSFHGQVSVGVGSGSNATIDFDTGNIQEITIPTETATSFTPSNAVAGSTYIIKITQAGTSGTMNWESSATVNWPGGTAPTLTATSGGVDIITLVCTAGGATGGTFYGTSALNFS